MNSRRILVAEDDAHIRQGLVDVLESEGYQVHAPASLIETVHGVGYRYRPPNQ